MNSLHLIGRLATDVALKEVNGGSKVSSYNSADLSSKWPMIDVVATTTILVSTRDASSG
jgi:hypothetical protein